MNAVLRRVEVVDEFGRADAVADASGRQSVDLGEGAQDQDAAFLAHIVERVRVVHATFAGQPVGVLEVGLIEGNHDVFRKAVEEAIHLLGGNHGPRGIVGIGDEDEPRFRVDGVGDGVEIEAVVAARNLAQLRTRRAGDDWDKR